VRSCRTETADALLALFGHEPEDSDDLTRAGALLVGELLLSYLPKPK
jgi:hypothetical protein